MILKYACKMLIVEIQSFALTGVQLYGLNRKYLKSDYNIILAYFIFSTISIWDCTKTWMVHSYNNSLFCNAGLYFQKHFWSLVKSNPNHWKSHVMTIGVIESREIIFHSFVYDTKLDLSSTCWTMRSRKSYLSKEKNNLNITSQHHSVWFYDIALDLSGPVWSKEKIFEFDFY